jgi:hypothetical protein
MKSSTKYITLLLFFFLTTSLCVVLVFSCKKTPDYEDETVTIAADTTTVDTLATEGNDETANNVGHRQGRNVSKKRPLTTAEIDSIKAERDKIVTPPDNVGASATPGSGRAVPGNNTPSPGNNASQGSSTGNK